MTAPTPPVTPPEGDPPATVSREDYDKLVAERDQWKQHSRTNEDGKKKATTELETLRKAAEGKPNEDDVAKRIADEVSKVRSEADQRALRGEVKAAAKGVLQDPNDAFQFLDLQGDAFKAGKDGQFDVAAIDTALADLVKAKPYLAVTKVTEQQASQRPGSLFGAASGMGAGGAPAKTGREAAVARSAQAHKDGDLNGDIAARLGLLTNPQ